MITHNAEVAAAMGRQVQLRDGRIVGDTGRPLGDSRHPLGDSRHLLGDSRQSRGSEDSR